jgi:hypothetical protein
MVSSRKPDGQVGWWRGRTGGGGESRQPTPPTLTSDALARRRPAVWHTPAGYRVLTPGEWNLVRAGLGLAWEAVEIAAEVGNPEATGVAKVAQSVFSAAPGSPLGSR